MNSLLAGYGSDDENDADMKKDLPKQPTTAPKAGPTKHGASPPKPASTTSTNASSAAMTSSTTSGVGLSATNTKRKVQIFVPNVASDAGNDDNDEEQPNSKRAKSGNSSGGGGLFAFLPAPKNAAATTTTTATKKDDTTSRSTKRPTIPFQPRGMSTCGHWLFVKITHIYIWYKLITPIFIHLSLGSISRHDEIWNCRDSTHSGQLS